MHNGDDAGPHLLGEQPLGGQPTAGGQDAADDILPQLLVQLQVGALPGVFFDAVFHGFRPFLIKLAL